MPKRTSFDIKKRILLLTKSFPMTCAQLERKINTGFRTIKFNSKELESYGFIKIEECEKHSKNGRPFFKIKITDRGLDFLNTF